MHGLPETKTLLVYKDKANALGVVQNIYILPQGTIVVSAALPVEEASFLGATLPGVPEFLGNFKEQCLGVEHF